MKLRPIPRTALKLSEIGFGCWTMGGPNWSVANGQPIGWADVNEDDILQGIKTGIDAGVNHWDNADIYGNGKAERLLAQSLKKLGIKRDAHILATKVGHFKGTAPCAYEPHHIRHQCEQSLKNLQTDHIDLYYFHHGTFTGPDYNNQTHDFLHEAAQTMHDLVKEGKVLAIGQSAYTDDDFERVVPVLKPHILQNKANLRYDDFIRPNSRLQSLMKTHDCAFVAFGPLDQGILLDKFDPANPPKFDEGDYRANRKDFNPNTLWAVREKLANALAHFNLDKLTGEDRVRALASIAQRWLLAHDRVCSVIPGFRNARQAACNVAAANDPPMSESDVASLRDLFKAV